MYSLSPHIVDGRRDDLIAHRPTPAKRRHRLPFGVLRGARMLRRAPRRAAA